MNKDYLIKKYQNRIALLEGRRGSNNANIINKLKRKIRALEKE
jgi:transcription antitermination factor NusA-like protein